MIDLFGRLAWGELKLFEFFHAPSIDTAVASGAAWMAVLGVLAVMAWLTVARRWGWLWSEWLTSVDHKKIGIMYMVIGFVMMARGIFEGIVMRALARKPENRYQTAADMASDLERFLHAHSPIFTPTKVTKWMDQCIGARLRT